MRTDPIDVSELTAILAQKKLLTDEQAAIVRVKAEAQRARLCLSQARGTKGRTRPGNVTPAEIIASLQLHVGGDGNAPLLDEDAITRCLAESIGYPYEKIDPLKLDHQLITGTVSLPFARRTSVLPLRVEGDVVVVAVSEPHDVQLFDELRRLAGRKLRLVLSARTDIQRYITEVYGFKRSVARAALEMAPSVDLGNLEQLVRLGNVEEIEANDRHVVSAVEYTLHYACTTFTAFPRRSIRPLSAGSRPCLASIWPNAVDPRTGGSRPTRRARKWKCASPRCRSPLARRSSSASLIPRYYSGISSSWDSTGTVTIGIWISSRVPTA